MPAPLLENHSVATQFNDLHNALYAIPPVYNEEPDRSEGLGSATSIGVSGGPLDLDPTEPEFFVPEPSPLNDDEPPGDSQEPTANPAPSPTADYPDFATAPVALGSLPPDTLAAALIDQLVTYYGCDTGSYQILTPTGPT
ncbi:uncharacterized protein N7496_010714 [Penicillium cataractarum]|uniref:Uncharacterized protein n=1 Tax=Penicillium cataractarum TaxID=2100454 RepID=A0A9W9UXC8_9EURO|nr:uncharacterized protein N7496_010714 [Penicillium cataractarum]KAJ5358301.1 hypothetical protein N7496_010714 [Penicillium cataractarum]